MLILTRKPGESIVIAEDVHLTFLGFDHHGKVKLGVEAPESVIVNRQEMIPKSNFPSKPHSL